MRALHFCVKEQEMRGFVNGGGNESLLHILINAPALLSEVTLTLRNFTAQSFCAIAIPLVDRLVYLLRELRKMVLKIGKLLTRLFNVAKRFRIMHRHPVIDRRVMANHPCTGNVVVLACKCFVIGALGKENADKLVPQRQRPQIKSPGESLKLVVRLFENLQLLTGNGG